MQPAISQAREVAREAHHFVVDGGSDVGDDATSTCWPILGADY